MKSLIAKQYLVLDNRSMLEVSLSRFSGLPGLQGAVLALAEADAVAPALLASFVDFPLHFVQGGATRTDSVRAALAFLTTRLQCEHETWVAVHDAARPCVHPSDVRKLLRQVTAAAAGSAGGLLAAPVRDTLKRANDSGRVASTLPRTGVFHALTPQLFPLGGLVSAMEQAQLAGELLTDEASAFEFTGMSPLLVEGRVDNIKVTHPEDLPLARLILQSQGVFIPVGEPGGQSVDTPPGETAYV
jgi:2-C-methyl-D-erythritol 4-phosphate cytidylyltransferase